MSHTPGPPSPSNPPSVKTEPMSVNDNDKVLNQLREIIIDWASRLTLMERTSQTICESGLVVVNWLEDVPFPCALSVKKGITSMKLEERALLLAAFNHPTQHPLLVKKYDTSVPSDQPVIIGAPPPPNSAWEFGRRQFLNKKQTMDWKGPLHLRSSDQPGDGEPSGMVVHEDSQSNQDEDHSEQAPSGDSDLEWERNTWVVDSDQEIVPDSEGSDDGRHARSQRATSRSKADKDQMDVTPLKKPVKHTRFADSDDEVVSGSGGTSQPNDSGVEVANARVQKGSPVGQGTDDDDVPLCRTLPLWLRSSGPALLSTRKRNSKVDKPSRSTKVSSTKAPSTKAPSSKVPSSSVPSAKAASFKPPTSKSSKPPPAKLLPANTELTPQSKRVAHELFSKGNEGDNDKTPMAKGPRAGGQTTAVEANSLPVAFQPTVPPPRQASPTIPHAVSPSPPP
ncbi:hypothetical protein CPB84DRAFT_1843833 [Gymnopilus junonius]|uniref:Uncharacterized protein n=1 Tax=Gymnopilus junonius TaxID=109634 RepID=A0A9P5NSH6_GYMJU|nr:hypothetical protein CPB84DRAFT_1843833 [Gymnopilus junonius]